MTKTSVKGRVRKTFLAGQIQPVSIISFSSTKSRGFIHILWTYITAFILQWQSSTVGHYVLQSREHLL